jgi:hypothetical protein
VGAAAAIGVVAGLLVVVQAGLLADLVARAFLGGDGIAKLTPSLLALAGMVAARAVLGWAGDTSHRPDAFPGLPQRTLAPREPRPGGRCRDPSAALLPATNQSRRAAP